jgi:hypothetical protein
MSLTKLSLDGSNLIIPGRGSFVSDIPAGDGKIINLFYSVAFPVLTSTVSRGEPELLQLEHLQFQREP